MVGARVSTGATGRNMNHLSVSFFRSVRHRWVMSRDKNGAGQGAGGRDRRLTLKVAVGT